MFEISGSALAASGCTGSGSDVKPTIFPSMLESSSLHVGLFAVGVVPGDSGLGVFGVCLCRFQDTFTEESMLSRLRV